MALRKVRSLAGGTSFIAGFIPWWKPFVAVIWAAAAATCRESRPDQLNDKRRKVQNVYVPTRRYRHALTWIRAFVGGWGQEARFFSLSPKPPSRLQVIMDASPWGMGAILLDGFTPIEYFGIALTTADLRRFNATIGESKFTTLWEALTLLICIRQWLVQRTALRIRLKSDSLGALRLAFKLSSPSPHLNQIAQEIALHLALDDAQVDLLEHVPGVTNIQADSLSRLFAPDAKDIPTSLSFAKRVHPCPRDANFWKAW